MLKKLPYEIPPSVLNKANNIQLALFDVDGVLTDGSLYYNSSGESLKRFNVQDGLGLKMLQHSGVQVGVISAKQSSALNARLTDLGINHQLTGISNKLTAFKTLIKTLNIDPKNACFTGDDIIDSEVMSACGLSFSVNNAHYTIKSIADWVSPIDGGEGAVRSICDLILYAKQAE